MQDPFVTADADREYIMAAVAAVQAARERGDHILLLEDTCGQPTHKAILDAMQGYDACSRLRKGQWDGSLQVEMELTALQLTPERITTCGAFAEECVIATIVGLRFRFPGAELEVLRNACCPRPTWRFTEADWLEKQRALRLQLV